MGRLSDLLNNKKKEVILPIDKKEPVIKTQQYKAKAALEQVVPSRLSSILKQPQQSNVLMGNLADKFKRYGTPLADPASLRIKSLTDIAKQQYIAGRKNRPAILGDLIKEQDVANIISSSPQNVRTRTEQTLGAIGEIPFIGKNLVSESLTERLKGQSKPIGKLPQVLGGGDITDVGLGEVATKVGMTVAQYSLVNNALKGLGTTSALGKLVNASSKNRFVSTQVADLLADTIVQTPAEVMKAIEDDKSLDQFAKDTLKARGIDVVANLIIGGAIEIPSFVKSLSDKKHSGMLNDLITKVGGTNPAKADEIRKSLTQDVKVKPSTIEDVIAFQNRVAKGENITKELGLAPETTAKDFLGQQAKDVQSSNVEDFYKQFDRTPQQITNDFQAWRSKNFGGATGQVSPEDMGALKQLYKEDTGIDLDVALKEVGATDAIKAVEPIKTVDSTPIIEPTVTKEPITTTATPEVTTPKLEEPKILSKLDEQIKKLDDDFKTETKRLKESVSKLGTNKELVDKRLKTLGFEHAAEKRKLIQGDSFAKVEGGLTSKELSNKIKKESTNYAGKEILTPDGPAKAIGVTSFGKVGVEFPDGSVKYFDSADIKPKVTVEELVNKSIVPEVKKVKVPELETLKPIEPVKVEAPKLPKAIKPEPVKAEVPKLKEVSKASPRIPDIKTPIAGESKSPFVERILEFLKGDQTTNQLRKELDNLDKLKTTTDKARETIAKQVVKDDFDGALRMSMEGKQFGNRVESNISLLLADELQRQGRHAEQVELISKVSEKFRAAGQDVQSAKAWAKASPEGMQKWAIDTLEKAKVKADPELIATVGKEMKAINEMTPEQLGAMVAKRLGKIGDTKLIQNQIMNSFSFDQLKGTNVALTMQKVFDKIPIVQARKLSSLQAMSHLLNFRTFSRNILGNTASIAAENVSKIPASIADRGLKAFTGNRTVIATMPKFLQGMQEGWKQGKRSFFEITAGVSTGNQGKYDLLFGSAFKSKLGKGLEKTMGISLQSTDEFYKGFVKADSLYNQLQARLGKEVKNWNFEKVMTEATESEIKAALDEAKFVTFQNDSALAGILSDTKKWANKLSANIPGTVFTKDFGLGDLVIKYTRVPGNIITRGIEYSPVGYLKAIHDASKVITEGTNASVVLQRQAAQALGRATTGTGLMLVGGALRNLGIITGVDNTKDWDVNAFNNAEGVGNYRINIDALERYIKGGNPEKQDGDTLKTYNWAAPITTPIAIGARLAGEDANLFSLEGMKLLTAATMDEALDLPTLSIVKKMMFEGMSGDSDTGNKMLDIMSVPIKEAFPSVVASIVRQTAQAIDPVIRDTQFGAKIPSFKVLGVDVGKGAEAVLNALGEKIGGRIQSNLPGFSKLLPPKLDPLGRESKREGGAFGALVDPASTSTYKPTGYGDTLRKISELSGKTTVFPDRNPPKSFSYKGNVIVLTEEEKKTWQEIEGIYVNTQYAKYLKGKTVKTEEDAIKYAEVLEILKKRAGEQAKSAVLKARR